MIIHHRPLVSGSLRQTNVTAPGHGSNPVYPLTKHFDPKADQVLFGADNPQPPNASPPPNKPSQPPTLPPPSPKKKKLLVATAIGVPLLMLGYCANNNGVDTPSGPILLCSPASSDPAAVPSQSPRTSRLALPKKGGDKKERPAQETTAEKADQTTDSQKFDSTVCAKAPFQSGDNIQSVDHVIQLINSDQVIGIVEYAENAESNWQLNLKNGNVVYWHHARSAESNPELMKAVDEKGVYPNPGVRSSGNALIGLLPMILIFALIIYMMRRASSMGAPKGLTGGKGVEVVDQPPDTRLDQVAGIPEVVEEIGELIYLMNNRQEALDKGIDLPKGVLLTGPGGTGKTLLARAIAGETQRKFINAKGSDFVEIYVGMGASRVRSLFADARKMAPSIIFIDEIDAVGKARSSGNSPGGGHDEREQTLNQILAEMDGFHKEMDILVIAATNRPDILDPALLRPGRFDRQYAVTPPMTPEGRRDVLAVHVRDKKLAPDIDLLEMAKRLPPGTVPAEIENVVKEANLLSYKRKHERIEKADMLDAIDRVNFGLAKKNVKFTDYDKFRIAAHEILGHAVTGWAQAEPEKHPDDESPVQFMSIVPRHLDGVGMALGLVSSETGGSEHVKTRRNLERQVLTTLAGRAAEQALFGEDETSTGASADWRNANRLMRQIIQQLPMYREYTGDVSLPDPEFGAPSVSNDQLKRCEDVQNDLMDGMYKMALTFIEAIPAQSRDQLIQTMMDRETINNPKEIDALFKNCGVDLRTLWRTQIAPMRQALKAKMDTKYGRA